MHDGLNAEARTEVAMNGCGPCCSGVRAEFTMDATASSKYDLEAVSRVLDDWIIG